MTEAAPVPEDLLAHAAFVRKLARSLLRDVNDVEDVEQETWRTVFTRPPGHGQNPRGWLTRVTQNFARRSLRSSARRTEHERGVARAEAELSFEAQLAREELLSRVVAAVRSLDEPYRAVILARFYEDLPPRKIAGRFGIPVETVHTRLKRALAQLRARLQNVEEDWRSTLGFLAGSDPAVNRQSLAMRFSRRVRFSAAAAALLLIGASLWIALLNPDRRPLRTTRSPSVANRILNPRPSLASLHKENQRCRFQVNSLPSPRPRSSRSSLQPQAMESPDWSAWASIL